MYDFSRCKLCGETGAAPFYDLGDSVVHVCPKCDFHYIDFLDTDAGTEKEEKNVLDRGARAYIEDRLEENGALLLARRCLMEEFLHLKGARVLDVGAGVGQFLEILSREGAKGVGIEPSRIRRAFALEKFGIELCSRRIEDPCWRAARFDAVTFWDVLEHVNFPAETIGAAFGALKAGGLLFVDTPSRDVAAYRLSHWAHRLSGGRIHLFLGAFYSPIPYGHKQIFRPEQLSALVNRVGCSVELLRRDYRPSRLNPGKRILLVARKPA